MRPFYSDYEWPSSDRFAALDHYAEEHCYFNRHENRDNRHENRDNRHENRDPPPAATETEPKEKTP
jgi:hypothetical protein